MHKEKRILVTGGSGFIGTNTMDFLLKKNIKVLNFDIKTPKKEGHKKFWKKIDIRDLLALESGMQEFKPTHILHLAAATGMDIDDISFFNANTIGVDNLITSCGRVDYVKRVLFTSSLLVCSNGYIPSSNEDYCPPNLYGKSKMIGEQKIKSAKDINFSWSIVRPTSVWGPYCEGGYTTFFKTIDRNFYMHPGKEEIIKPITYVGNTVFMMLKILLSEEQNVEEQTYYLSDYPECSTREWSRIIQESLQTREILSCPMFLMKTIAFIGDCLQKIGYSDPPLTSFRLGNMLTGGIYPTNNTKEICGELPFSVESGANLTLEWLYNSGEIRNKPI